MSSLIPQPGRLIIKDQTEEQVGGLTILKEENQREGVIGEVIAVGGPEERYDANGEAYAIPMNIQKGDIVAYTKYHYSELSFQGEKYKVIKFEDVLAKIL